MIDNPTAYANNAILAAKYARFEIRTHDGAVEIETTTGEGTRTRRYDSAEALQAGLERDGVNAFLEAQERDAAAVLDATIDALWMKRSETVIRIEPEKLTHERETSRRSSGHPPSKVKRQESASETANRRCRSETRHPNLRTHRRERPKRNEARAENAPPPRNNR